MLLVELNLIAGQMAHVWVYPEEWKGRIPKEKHQPTILQALGEEEVMLVEGVMPSSLRNNAIDAVGIGLYFLGRMEPVRAHKQISKRKVRPSHKRNPRRLALK
jgi:hypothetical protein